MDCLLPTRFLCPWLFQARILIAIFFSADCPDPGIGPLSPASSWVGRWILYHWATWEAPLFLLVLLFYRQNWDLLSYTASDRLNWDVFRPRLFPRHLADLQRALRILYPPFSWQFELHFRISSKKRHNRKLIILGEPVTKAVFLH